MNEPTFSVLLEDVATSLSSNPTLHDTDAAPRSIIACSGPPRHARHTPRLKAASFVLHLKLIGASNGLLDETTPGRTSGWAGKFSGLVFASLLKTIFAVQARKLEVGNTMTTYHFTVNVSVGGERVQVIGKGRCGRDKFCLVEREYRYEDRICIPHNKMRPVPDEIAVRWQHSSLQLCATPQALGQSRARIPRPGGIVLLGESPHKCEFDQSNNPVGPMRDKKTRQNICQLLPGVIEKARNVLGIDLTDCDVVISNPVQFQASLAHFMSKQDTPLQPWLRNAVWKALFSDESIKEDFRRRMRDYNPRLVVVAPTYAVRKLLLDELRNSSLWECCIGASHHPCVWNPATLKTWRASETTPPHYLSTHLGSLVFPATGGAGIDQQPCHAG